MWLEGGYMSLREERGIYGSQCKGVREAAMQDRTQAPRSSLLPTSALEAGCRFRKVARCEPGSAPSTGPGTLGTQVY